MARAWSLTAVLLGAASVLVPSVLVSGLVETDPVVKLTGKTYDTSVSDGQVWFVKYFAPWCGHCKKLAPAWKELAELYHDDDKVSIAHVDCTKERDVCQINDVKGYPTLKVIYNGEEHTTYRGQRDLESMKAFLAATKEELTAETTE